MADLTGSNGNQLIAVVVAFLAITSATVLLDAMLGLR